MPRITFLPDNITVESPKGAPLLEAARSAGVFVETPCGGNGTCQKCLVQIQNDKSVLICQTAVPDNPITIILSKNNRPGNVSMDQAEAQRRKEAELSFNDTSSFIGNSLNPFIKKLTLTVGEPALLDGLSDADRFIRAFLSAIRANNADCQSAELPLNVLARLPEKLRQTNGKILVYYGMEKTTAKVVDIIPLSGSSIPVSYGIAVDIGTTTVALALVCLDDGKALSVHNSYNSQVECGLDVISRINYAKKNLSELQARIVKTINDLINAACKETGIDPDNIVCASLAGNTTMTHLLLGIAPEYIRLSPYTPAVFRPQCYTAGELGLSLCKNAPLLFAPAIGSYVGGDITAGLLCTSLALPDSAKSGNPLALFIDIGTNGEIVLGNSEFIFACACSAGPAFEGGGIKHGVRAQTGAIEKLVIGKDGKPEIYTIGNAPPIGICGSGVISAIAELFRKGVIDSAGKFAQKNGEYNLCPGISLNETDIDNFIRAKGAIFSACQTMLDSVNMSFSDIEHFYVAGGFGRFLDLEDAGTIGLLPRIAEKKYTFLGNSSCFGAYLSLVSEEQRAKMNELAEKITYVDLSSEPAYMDHYTGALFLPHTDKSLFEKNI